MMPSTNEIVGLQPPLGLPSKIFDHLGGGRGIEHPTFLVHVILERSPTPSRYRPPHITITFSDGSSEPKTEIPESELRLTEPDFFPILACPNLFTLFPASFLSCPQPLTHPPPPPWAPNPFGSQSLWLPTPPPLIPLHKWWLHLWTSPHASSLLILWFF